jgi:hypothetical protein
LQTIFSFGSAGCSGASAGGGADSAAVEAAMVQAIVNVMKRCMPDLLKCLHYSQLPEFAEAQGVL